MGKRTGKPVGRPKKRGETSASTVRIETEANFALDLLVNHFRGRPKNHIIEDAAKRLADEVLRYGPAGRTTWQELWDPIEAVRELRKLVVDGYNPTAEELVQRKFLRAHHWLFYTDAACTSPRYGTAEFLWPRLKDYITTWREAGQGDISGVIAKELKAAGIPLPKRND